MHVEVIQNQKTIKYKNFKSFKNGLEITLKWYKK